MELPGQKSVGSSLAENLTLRLRGLLRLGRCAQPALQFQILSARLASVRLVYIGLWPSYGLGSHRPEESAPRPILEALARCIFGPGNSGAQLGGFDVYLAQ